MKIDRETDPKVLEAMHIEIETLQKQLKRNIRQLELFQDSVEARLQQLEEENAVTAQCAVDGDKKQNKWNCPD